MSGSDDRVQEALAAHLEQLELGGPEPDVSHLTEDELGELRDLIGLLDATEGVAFGRGKDEARDDAVAATEAGRRLVAALREALPPASRIATDPVASAFGLPGADVLEGFVVGTFGGRARVWLLGGEGSLAASDEWLRRLDRLFRLFPDTIALALVEPDHSCLLVEPEDCAPTIEVPRGSLVGRRYRRPIHPVEEALSVFFRELTPYWEPMERFSGPALRAIDVPPIAQELAARAIAEQVAAGGRARKTNPKRKALTELGDTEAGKIANVLLGVHEGGLQPDDVERELRRLASER